MMTCQTQVETLIGDKLLGKEHRLHSVGVIRPVKVLKIVTTRGTKLDQDFPQCF